jgi:L-ascorbate metabolism protein UlaG (beta-lactamase superfamily)
MIGFETIGNATLICHDEEPILATDPWLSESAYFGSWTLTHVVPAEQLANIFACQYIWLSHGHPDHLDAASLNRLRDKTILLPDHVGKRIYDGLLEGGYDVHIIKDADWLQLSNHIKVMCLFDYNQDATLLVDIHGRLIVNFNDATARGWEKLSGM